MSFAARFQQVVDQLAQGNKKQFAELSGKSASHIYKICRGLSRPSMAFLQHLYDEFQVDITWLVTGNNADGGNPAGVLNSRDQVHAPVFDVKASAGAGLAVEAENIDAYFSFNKQFLSRQLGVSSEQLAFVTIDGDSMEPTLFDGDQVLVDLTQTQVNQQGVYLLNADREQSGDNALVAKRLSASAQGKLLNVDSDNPDYPRWQLDLSQCEVNPVLGKIVWSARTV